MQPLRLVQGEAKNNTMNDSRQPLRGNPEDDEETPAERRNINIVLALFFVLLLGSGYWLVNAMLAQRDMDNCVGQGRRNCNPVTVPDSK